MDTTETTDTLEKAVETQTVQEATTTAVTANAYPMFIASYMLQFKDRVTYGNCKCGWDGSWRMVNALTAELGKKCTVDNETPIAVILNMWPSRDTTLEN